MVTSVFAAYNLYTLASGD